MAAPKTTIWKLEPHTRAKHAILQRYLQAWVPILTLGGFPEVVYIDGFAGPGRYSEGEDGSPIIALKAALGARIPITAKIHFRFIELHEDRAAVLQSIIDDMKLPLNFYARVYGGRTFEDTFKELHTRYRQRFGKLPPTFAFIDPFGWTGVPFSVVVEIMKFLSCEVLVTFMYEEINRFIGHPDQEANFDAFFGTPNWRKCITLADAGARNRCLHDLYLQQLRETAGAKYVRSFEMRNERGVTDLYLFYATNNLLGLRKMKEAMWKVDEAGEFRFSDATDLNQFVLFAKEPRYEVLQRQVLARFRGRETTVGEIEEFVLTETAFRETHYKQQVLKPLELADPPGLTVPNPPPGRKRGKYPDKSMRIRFV